MVGTVEKWMTGFGKELENPNDSSFLEKREALPTLLHSSLSPPDGVQGSANAIILALVRVDRQNRTTAD